MISRIVSHRRFRKDFFYGIIYEWEDVIAKNLGLSIDYSYLGVKGFGTRILNRLNLLYKLICSGSEKLYFVANIGMFDADAAGRKNIIPVIIDFFERDKASLKRFCDRYTGNKLVLITSREAYEFLTAQRCDLPIRHWALSLPDKYEITESVLSQKKYDCVLVGRPDSVFSAWLKRYHASHSDFVFVENKRLPQGANCYVTSDGKVLGDIVKTRADYMELLRFSKAGLYSTPGIGGRMGANGFDQVTPRFLEYIACGCHVLARYPKNPDTDWYELPMMAPHIETYEQFEKAMDNARSRPVDFKTYSDYLKKHYTSVRAQQLKSILEEFE